MSSTEIRISEETTAYVSKMLNRRYSNTVDLLFVVRRRETRLTSVHGNRSSGRRRYAILGASPITEKLKRAMGNYCWAHSRKGWIPMINPLPEDLQAHYRDLENEKVNP